MANSVRKGGWDPGGRHWLSTKVGLDTGQAARLDPVTAPQPVVRYPADAEEGTAVLMDGWFAVYSTTPYPMVVGSPQAQVGSHRSGLARCGRGNRASTGITASRRPGIWGFLNVTPSLDLSNEML